MFISTHLVVLEHFVHNLLSIRYFTGEHIAKHDKAAPIQEMEKTEERLQRASDKESASLFSNFGSRHIFFYLISSMKLCIFFALLISA